MIPIMQRVVKHDPENGAYGDCFSAVLASLLHLPLEEVPVFTDKVTWENDVNAWLRQYGLAYIQISGVREWATDRGVEGMYHEIAGASPRDVDILHSCVGLDGELVHDPHPDNTGIGEPLGSYGLFIALEPWRMLHDTRQLP